MASSSADPLLAEQVAARPGSSARSRPRSMVQVLRHEFVAYPGVGHGFLGAGADDPAGSAAAADAWRRVRELFESSGLSAGAGAQGLG
ncbi:dienelactone hydrolase family protein [Kitasatospora sp. NPDC001175]|uniref:dienelactone hydrolase family protein n=1 Tax=Kitasatospora sp. NPDC001175 TaxID=3157103 RepID=UPI003D08D1A9